MSRTWEPMLERLLTDRYAALTARARVLGVGADHADDLIQAALVATFSRPRSFENLAHAEAYVKRAIVTEFLDDVRRRRLEDGRWLQREQGRTDPAITADPATRVGARVDVERALNTLAPRERACIALRYLDDLSIADVASHLGLSTGAVKRYVHDGLGRLNAALGTSATVDGDHIAQVTAPKGGAR